MKEEFLNQIDEGKKNGFRKKLMIFVTIIVVVAIISGLFYVWLNRTINVPVNKNSQVYEDLIIEEGMGVGEIADKLFEAEIINSDFAFKYYVWANKKSGDFKPGLFTVNKNMNIPEIISVLTNDRSGEIQLTLPEGLTVSEIASEVTDEFARTSQGTSLSQKTSDEYYADFIEATDQEYDFAFLADKPADQGLEGYLFPDTYRIYRSAGMPDVVEKMLINFGEKVTPRMIEQMQEQNWTIHEVLTLASIVQKEARIEDMPEVAGIFISRLKQGKRLESDATVNYVTGNDKLQPTFKETEIDSPYNTYRITGLPPGPIANPGLDAIEAVLNPEISSNLYFLNTPEGDTLFSVTYEEHLEKKKKFLDNNNDDTQE